MCGIIKEETYHKNGGFLFCRQFIICDEEMWSIDSISDKTGFIVN